MATGPGRGAFDVYVDGTKITTVDTHAVGKANRVVVWQRAFGQGKHTVRLVNKATAGHARIDLDAVLNN